MSSTGDFLTFSSKRTERIDLKRPIMKYVERTYGKDQGSDTSTDIDEVCRRRSEVVAVSGGGTSDSAKDIYASYYRALSVMETRFPISRDSDHAQVSFCWTSASASRRRSKQMNIHFEKASVLFNIAAILSQKGAVQNRETQEGYKSAIQYFQEAAGAFNLAGEVALKVDNPKPSDLTSNFLTFAEKLMLAQGQECVFWRAMKDKKSASTLSKVSRCASLLYSEALGLMISPAVKEEVDRNWQDFVQSKSWLFEALCQHNAAEDACSKEDIAVEISRLNQALMLLQKLQKNGKYLTPSIPAFIKELVGVINQRLKAAERDNASIYLKRVPPFNQLPEVDGVQIVKVVSASQLLDASKEHIFGDLIPEPVTKALSRYSDIVDRLIRHETERLNQATDEARVKLRQYELPEVLDAISVATASLIPESLRKDLEDIEEGNGIRYIDEMNEQIGALRENSVTEMGRIEGILDEEAALDAGLREQYGQQWNTPTSASQNSVFRKQVASYRENLETAKNSDKVIQDKLAQNREKLTGLSVQQVLAVIPKLEAGIITLGEMEPPMLVTNIRRCLTQLDAISEERGILDNELKEMKEKDNLLNKLSSTGVGSHDELFNVELAKYDPLKQEVTENLDKQKQLLDYLAEVYSTFQQAYNITEWRQQVDRFCKDLKNHVAAFYDVRNNVGEGMRFYMNLKEAIDKVKQQSCDFVMSRKFDREDRLEMLKARDTTQQQQQQETRTPPVPTGGQFPPNAPPPPVHSFSGSSVGYTPPPPLPPDQPSAPPIGGGYHASGGVSGRVHSFNDGVQESPNLPAPPPPPQHGYASQQYGMPGYPPGQHQNYQPTYQPVNPQMMPSGAVQYQDPQFQNQHQAPQGYPPLQQSYPYQDQQSPPPPPPPPTDQYFPPPNYGYHNQ